MKLRYLTIYNEHGLDGERTLQIWNEDLKMWEDIPDIRCSKDDVHIIYEEEERLTPQEEG